MTAITPDITLATGRPRLPGRLSAVRTLAGRRFALTVRTPRELLVPLITPMLFAMVIAPALKNALHTGVAYEAIVAVGTIGLLIPLNTMFSGLSVIGDRESGARRELLAAPVSRPLIVVGNLIVALATTAFQVAALLFFAHLRRIHFDATASRFAWFAVAAVLFAVGMYGVAELLASRVSLAEEYISRLPAIAIVPWFLAGSLFPITALPVVLEWIARFLPLTHALAVMRYGLLGDPQGLEAIWHRSDPTAMALLSLAVVAAFAIVLTAASIRVFAREAVR